MTDGATDDGSAAPIAQSVVLIALPELDPVIGDLRLAHDPAAADHIPSHITLNFPFVPPGELDAPTRSALTEIAAETNAFYVEFPEVEYFTRGDEYIVHLRAEPADVLRRLAIRIHERWPQYPLFGGAVPIDEYVPHVTIGYGDAGFLAEVRSRIGPQLPLSSRATALAVLTGVVGERWLARCVAPFR